MLLCAVVVAGCQTEKAVDAGFQHSDHPPPAFIAIENDGTVPCKPVTLWAVYGHGVPVKVTLCEWDAGR